MAACGLAGFAAAGAGKDFRRYPGRCPLRRKRQTEEVCHYALARHVLSISLLASLEHNHARVEIIRLRVEARRRQQLLRRAVVEINVAFPLSSQPLGNKREVA